MPELSHREGKGEALQVSVAGEWRSRPAEARLARPGTRPVGGRLQERKQPLISQTVSPRLEIATPAFHRHFFDKPYVITSVL